ncbi:toll/interleukin-1 receptor domain-containing protein [Maricaulis virginensis]|uniref:toll/interleukin-1 receptor domain-containing protein n=1 Tax=Maricaulis virginensis TaxID=144022 RepID=UPI0035A328A3
MARCTAPVQGHRSASAAAACPACRGRTSRYSSYSPYSSSYSSPYSFSGGGSSSRSTGGGSGGSTGRSSGSSKPRWSPSGSSAIYTEQQVRALEPVRTQIEKREIQQEPRDVFLCHAWDDRAGAAKELHDSLEAQKVTVWFSEKDVLLGSNLLREIDRGLARSRVGIVLVTPSFLKRISGEGIADKELSALLARDLLVPIVHNTTYEALREVSPLLGSRTGLSTAEDQMSVIATKLAELVAL